MFNITLISSRHENLGECNSNELYKIIESIKPEVIFEEIPPTFFNKYYVEKSRSNLEVDAINKYILKYKTKQIPVDLDEAPSEEFFKDYEYLIKKIEGLTDFYGFTFRNLTDKNKRYIEEFGFRYLNSNDSVKMNIAIYEAIKNGLQKINDEKLFRIFKSWEEVNELREIHMLQQIYNYSKEHCYEKAIFTVGAAHRNSIIEKISIFQKTGKIKLKWN